MGPEGFRCVPLVALIAMAAPGPAAAQDVALPRLEFISEAIEPMRQVSGSVVVGVMTAIDNVTGQTLTLHSGGLDGTTADARELCVEVTSRAREYSAQARLLVPAGSPLPTSVRYAEQSRMPDVVQGMTARDVAVRVQNGGCAAGTAETLAPLIIAEWGEMPARTPPHDLVVLLNARTSEAAVLLSSAGTVIDRKACARIEDAHLTGYDFKCELSLMDLPADATRIEGMIARRDFGQNRPPVSFEIVLGEEGAP